MISLKTWLLLLVIVWSYSAGQELKFNDTNNATETQNDTASQGNDTSLPPPQPTAKDWTLNDLPHTVGAPDYYRFSSTPEGKLVPCFRASFNGSLLVEYYTTDDKLEKHIANFSMNSTVSGECGPEHTNVTLSWGGQNFDAQSLTFNFSVIPPNENDEIPMKTWVASSINFKLDLSRKEFINPKKAKNMTVSTPTNETHFQTPVGLTYACQSHNKIELDHFKKANESEINRQVIKDIILDIWNVRIHAFDLDPHGHYSKVAPCALDIETSLAPRHIIPIVVAAVLCGVIVIMIVTYYFMRQRNKTTYTAM